MANSRAVLLVIDNRHPTIESNIGHRVYRYTGGNACIQMIQNERANCRRIDLFLSSEDRGIIGNNLPLFSNIYFHLYCPTVDDIPYYEILFPIRAYVQVFEEDLLWLQISHAILAQDLTRLVENYSTEARDIYEATNRIVLQEVEAAKLGVQPQ